MRKGTRSSAHLRDVQSRRVLETGHRWWLTGGGEIGIDCASGTRLSFLAMKGSGPREVPVTHAAVEPRAAHLLWLRPSHMFHHNKNQLTMSGWFGRLSEVEQLGGKTMRVEPSDGHTTPHFLCDLGHTCSHSVEAGHLSSGRFLPRPLSLAWRRLLPVSSPGRPSACV